MDQWTKISERFHEWSSPLRPCLEDVELFKSQVHPDEDRLLLGITQELLPFASTVVDNNPAMIKSSKAQAILADWGSLPFEQAFDTVLGDGCLTVFQGPPEGFFKQVKKVLRPKGKLILRVFISPDVKEPLETVLENKQGLGFHAFKWSVAHALANPYVPVQEIYRVMRPVWDHPTLEVYKDSDLIYYFPKLSDLPPWTHIQFGSSYELAERCPVITWEFG